MTQADILVETAGWLGAIVLLGAYGALSAGRLHAGGLYQWMNLAGAAGLMVNAAYHGSWPPVAVNVTWAVIAVSSLVRGMTGRAGGAGQGS
jgi:hypothetical protein